MSSAVIVKLTNGDTLMAGLIHENDNTIIVENPVMVKVMQQSTPQGIIERTVTAPFCSLTDDKEFSLDRRHVLFVSNLHPAVEAMYYRIVDAFGDEMHSFLDQLGSRIEQEDYQEPDEEDLFLVIPEEQKIH